MNIHAEAFKQYLDENEIKVFQVEELQDDPLHTVVFRSNIAVQGNNLPTLVVLDDSIYGMIRLLVAPSAKKEENEVSLLKLMNEYNRKYKSFKYYLDNEGNLVLDSCVLLKDEQVSGELVYTMFNVIIAHLEETYKDTMKAIWA